MKNTIKKIHPHFDSEDVQATIEEYNYYLENNDAMVCVRFNGGYALLYTAW